MLVTDMHQHLWPEPVMRALEQRDAAPCARRTQDGWLVRIPGEPDFLVEAADHDIAVRAADVHRAGIDRALVALSSPVGIEALPPEEAAPILSAWSEAAVSLPAELGWWGSLPLAAEPELIVEAADAALDAGAAGIVVGAGWLGDPRAVLKAAPLLDRLTDRNAPLFVHPGPSPDVPTPVATDAAWWAPSVRYVSELHAAWHAWSAAGSMAHPGLRVVWAALAGLAPLHAERTALRGGPVLDDPDPCQFYDTSGYGPHAVRMMADLVGTSQLVHGTDRPVVSQAGELPFDTDTRTAIKTRNVSRLLDAACVAA